LDLSRHAPAPETLIATPLCSPSRTARCRTPTCSAQRQDRRVGKNLKRSANARVIDGTGKFVMPGIIDCHSHSMLDTINEGTLASLDGAHAGRAERRPTSIFIASWPGGVDDA
jgi:hypothetical protein